MQLLIIASLIIFPVVVALLLMVIRNEAARSALVIGAVVILGALSVVLTVQYLLTPQSFVVPEYLLEPIHYCALAIGLACTLYVLVRAIRAKKILVILLAVGVGVLIVVYEMAFAHYAVVKADLYVDQLSIIMALIIAFIGGGICLYAIYYMRDHQKHLDHEGHELPEENDPALLKAARMLLQDRRHIFFAILFVFLGAMFAIVFSNRLSWLLVGWEVITLCSFVLIGYTRTKEATNNAFRAVAINMSGSLALAAALIMVAMGTAPIFELDLFIATAANSATGGVLALPVMLIAFACMTKAAQMPFQSWLLGAMVAPTPVSALLHSATMVKAGVFILIKLSPALGWNLPGLFVLIIGGLSFLGCTALSISQSNSKRVLAYSTVANLGLIAMCAGIGTPEAAWAGIFLLIFHAAAKALLFCCIGTAEHHLGSRDIEKLDNIFVRMPWIATFLAVGMMAMFIAPFGMLVSKWAALVSIAESGHMEMLFILAFGSALTFVVWAKWLGKALAVGNTSDPETGKAGKGEFFTLAVLAALLVIITLAIPLVSSVFVVPWLKETGVVLGLLPWIQASDVLGSDNLIIMSIIFLALLGLLLAQLLKKRPEQNDTIYLAGVGSDKDERGYSNSFGEVVDAGHRNWYMDKIFGENAMGRQATIMIGAVMVIFLVLGVVLELISL